MIFKFQSSFKQSIQNAPRARTKPKGRKDTHLSRGYLAGLRAGGSNVTSNYNMMTFKKQKGAKFGPTFQPPVNTPLLKMFNERQTLNGEFYDVKDPVTMGNFKYTKSFVDKPSRAMDASGQRKIFRDQKRDREIWRRLILDQRNLKNSVNAGFATVDSELQKANEGLFSANNALWNLNTNMNAWQQMQSTATSAQMQSRAVGPSTIVSGSDNSRVGFGSQGYSPLFSNNGENTANTSASMSRNAESSLERLGLSPIRNIGDLLRSAANTSGSRMTEEERSKMYADVDEILNDDDLNDNGSGRNITI